MIMKNEMSLCQLLVLLYCVVFITADDYEKNTKVWSVNGAVNSGASVVRFSGDSIVLPSSYQQYAASRRSRDMNLNAPDIKQYIFRPRAIPLGTDQPQESNVYYSQDNKYKTEILFPGNSFTIAKEKSNENLTRESAYNSVNSESFKPKTIPLMRGQDFQKRSLDEEEPLEEEAEEISDLAASRRSLSYVLGVDEDEDNEEEEGDEEIEDDGEYEKESKSKIKNKLKKAKKYSKYMMPLLLAYKLKYFALVPVMIAGLVLLTGATGMAGFFFALFAAVMGLQKGGY